MNLLIILLTWVAGFISLSFFARYDAKILNSGEFIHSHTSRAWLKGLSCLIIPLPLLFLYGTLPYIGIVLSIVLLHSSTFSPLLALMIGEDFYHLGTTAEWDKMWWRIGLKYYVMFVIATYWLSVTLPFITYILWMK